MNSEISKFLQRLFIFLIFSCFAFLSAVHALPFQIVPKEGTVLPTIVNFNDVNSVSAFYTVYNNTVAPRLNNFVKYLPPNVRQISVGGTYPDTCGLMFNLAGKGQPGSSCTLQLEIFGPVNPTDPNPRNHLLVCFPRGTTCAGTIYELNVTPLALISIAVVPLTASANSTQTIQYQATGIYTNNVMANITNSVSWHSSNLSVATISATGLATAHAAGSTVITAGLLGVLSNTATLTVANPLVSISVAPSNASIGATQTQQFTATGTYANGSTADISNAVTWQSSNTNVGTINSTGLATGVSAGSTEITAVQGSVTSNSAMLNVDNPLLSIAITPTTGTVTPHSSLQFTATGLFTDGSHQDITQSVTWNSSNMAAATISTTGLAQGVAIGTSNITATMTPITSNTAVLTVQSFAYVVNLNASISYCNLSGTSGTLTGCLNNTDVANPQQITVNPLGTFGYVTQSSTSNGVFICSLSATDGSLSTCGMTGDLPLTTPGQIAINPANTFAYIANATGIVKCNINSSTGVLSSCSLTGDVTFTNPIGVAINPTGTFAYITDGTTNRVTYCSINSNGALFDCTSASTHVFGGPTTIAISPSGTAAYISDFGTNIVTSCPINDPTGNFGTCVDLTGFFGPRGIALNAAGNLLYVANSSNNTVTVCTVAGATLSGCTPQTNPFAGPFGIAVN